MHHLHCQPRMHMSRKSTRSLNTGCALDIIEFDTKASLLPLDPLLGHANHKADVGTKSPVKLHCSQGVLDRSKFENHAVRHQHLNSKTSHNLPCKSFYTRTSTTDLRVKNLNRRNRTGRHTLTQGTQPLQRHTSRPTVGADPQYNKITMVSISQASILICFNVLQTTH